MEENEVQEIRSSDPENKFSSCLMQLYSFYLQSIAQEKERKQKEDQRRREEEKRHQEEERRRQEEERKKAEDLRRRAVSPPRHKQNGLPRSDSPGRVQGLLSYFRYHSHEQQFFSLIFLYHNYQKWHKETFHVFIPKKLGSPGTPGETTSEVRKWLYSHCRTELKSFLTVYDNPILVNIGMSYTVRKLLSSVLQ